MAAATPIATHRRQSVRVLLAAAGATAAFTACSNAPSNDAHGETNSSTSSPAASSDQSVQACVTAQRRATRAILGDGIGTEIYDTTRQRASATWLGRNIRRGERAALDACGEIPDAMAEFTTAAREQIRAGTYDAGALNTIFDAGYTWARTIDATAGIDRSRKRWDQCAHFADTITATYRITVDPDAAGKTWNVELTWDNRSGQHPWGETGGTVIVTGYNGLNIESMQPHRSGGLTASWGGSRATPSLTSAKARTARQPSSAPAATSTPQRTGPSKSSRCT